MIDRAYVSAIIYETSYFLSFAMFALKLKTWKLPTTLVSLNDDVLLLILQFLMTSSYYLGVIKRPHTLLPLASTCKRLRDICCSQLFRCLTWPGHAHPIPTMSVHINDEGVPTLLATYEEIPAKILPHIRHLHIECETHFSAVNIAKAIQSMTSLVHCILDCKHEPPMVLLRAIAKVSSLAHLELLQTPLTFPSDALVSQHRALSLCPATGYLKINGGPKVSGSHTSRDSQHTLVSEGHGPLQERIDAWRKNIAQAAVAASHLITHSLNTLETLHIHHELIPWYPSHDILWPRLQKLVIMGQTPQGQQTPTLAILEGMPSLRDLQFTWSQTVNGPTTCLIPHSKSIYATFLSSRCPNLTHLTISNPSHNDLIFSMLPTSVQRLYLPIISEGDHTGSCLDHTQLMKVLASVRNSNATITSLKIILPTKQDITPDVLLHLANKFPSLIDLEVGANHYSRWGNPKSLVPYIRALQNFPRLEHLYIALAFNDNIKDSWFGAHPEELAAAKSLAMALPWIKSISFQSVTHLPQSVPTVSDFHSCWTTWTHYGVVREDYVDNPDVIVHYTKTTWV